MLKFKNGEISTMGATISISRDSGYTDRLRNYRVILDGEEIGCLANAERKNFTVVPGQHNLVVKIDWCRSNMVSFTILSDQILHFQCGSNLRGSRILLTALYVFFLWDNYLWLKQE